MSWKTPKLHVCEHTHHTVILKFPFNRAFNEELKELGARWTPEVKAWTLGESMIPPLRDAAASFGMELLDTRPTTYTTAHDQALRSAIAGLDHLYPFQRDALLRTLGKHARIFAFSTGLGKTLTTIMALMYETQKFQGQTSMRILIVCPAIVRMTWQEELTRWWPDHPPVTVLSPKLMLKVKAGKEVLPLDEKRIYITSYEMIKHVPEELRFDAIVIDEMHMLANAKSQRSKYVAHFVEHNMDAYKIGLTATLIPNKLENLHHPLHCVAPGSWGSGWRFIQRYCNTSEGRYGLEIHGPKDEMLPELRQRLEMYAIQVTKDEVADVLPPFTMQTFVLEAPAHLRTFDAKTLVDVSAADIRAFVDASRDTKIEATLEKVESLFEEGNDRICVAVFRKETGYMLEEKLRAKWAEQGVHVAWVSGDVSQEERKKLIAEAKAQPRSIVIVTYHSVGIGINDLVDFNHVVLTELYWQPGIMQQFLGRFQRLSSTRPIWLHCLVIENTVEEAMARTLRTKLSTINTVLKSGKVDRDFEHAMDTTRSDEAILQKLRELTCDFDFDIRDSFTDLEDM